MPTEYVVVNAIVGKLTEKAALLYFDNTMEEKWVPRSVIEDGESLEAVDDYQDIHIAKWWCDKEGVDA